MVGELVFDQRGRHAGQPLPLAAGQVAGGQLSPAEDGEAAPPPEIALAGKPSSGVLYRLTRGAAEGVAREDSPDGDAEDNSSKHQLERECDRHGDGLCCRATWAMS